MNMVFEVFGVQLNYFLVHTEIFSEYRKEKFLTKFLVHTEMFSEYRKETFSQKRTFLVNNQ